MSADATTPPEFHLHFQGEGTRDHTVPASALVQAVQALQRSVNLLAIAHEGKDFKKRLRVSYELERKYAVVLKVPEDASYDIPYVIGATAYTLFEPEDVAIVTKQHQDGLAAVQNGDVQALKRIIPNADVRRQFATSLKNMQPPRRMGLVVNIEDARRQRLLDGNTVAARVEPVLSEPTSPIVQPRIVTGRLDAIDFQGRHLTLALSSGRMLTCSYEEDFEPVLLENPRELIQVRGEAVLNEDDSLKALNNVTEIVEIDNSPVVVTSIIVDGTPRAASIPLSFSVSFDTTEGLYTATGDFHMMVAGETREELEKAVANAMDFLWREYVAVDPSTLSADAIVLREQLSKAFSGEK